MTRAAALFFLILLSFAAPAQAEKATGEKTHSPPFRAVTIADGLDYPWAVAFLPDGDFLVTTRGGKLWRVGPDNRKTEIGGLPDNIVARRQGGLFDVILHPDFAQNDIIYLSYNGKGEGGHGTEIARAALRDDKLENLRVIFAAQPKMRSDVHFGGRLLLHDGYLYLTLGDRMNMQGAQDTATHWGGIVRLHEDGSIPPDNPFAAQDGARPELYAIGSRNAQGLAVAPDGTIWFHEHGPQGGDELNILAAGANYGWPAVTYGIDYDGRTISSLTERADITPPVQHWVPSIAPSGLTIYDGDKFPYWRGDILAGALAGRHVRHLGLENRKVVAQDKLYPAGEERVRDIRTGPDGYIYLLTDSAKGRLIRVEPR